MADFTLSKESVEMLFDYNVETSKFENQTTLARLVTSNMLVGFRVQTPRMTQAGMQDYLSFFQSKYGSAISFTFLCPLDGVTYTVRFVKGTFKVKYEDAHYKAQFDLERTF